MHVLSVIHYPVYGGPHNCNASVIPLLEQRGIHVTVALPDEPGNAVAMLAERGVDVVSMPLSRLRGAPDPRIHIDFARRFRSDVIRLRRLIRDRKIDLVLVNGLVNPHSAVAANLEGIPVVWQLLDTFAPRALRAALMPVVVRLADVIMSTGRAVAVGHPGATSFGDRLVLFFPSVDTSKFVNTAEIRADARRALGLADADLVIGNVANINPMKGHDIFIAAAAKVRVSRPGAKFVILGSESSRHAGYAKQLRETAATLGLEPGRDLIIVDPGNQVAAMAPAFDVFWLTSRPRSEGIPTVIGEAMSLQLPVVASRVGSVEEAIEDGVTGRLVQSLEPLGYEQATLPYLDDQQLRAATGRRGRESAAQLYSPELCAHRHEHAFALANERPRWERR